MYYYIQSFFIKKKYSTRFTKKYWYELGKKRNSGRFYLNKNVSKKVHDQFKTHNVVMYYIYVIIHYCAIWGKKYRKEKLNITRSPFIILSQE